MTDFGQQMGQAQMMQALMQMQQQNNEVFQSLARLFADRVPNADQPAPGSQWPRQQIEGVIKFPQLEVQPFMWGYVELTEDGVAGGPSYATTAITSEATISVNDIKSFVTGVHFRLQRTIAPDGSPLPVGTWLPFGSKYHPFIATGDLYVGKDFTWDMQSTQDGLFFQGSNGTSTRSSNDLDVNGYFAFGQEYQCQPRDSFSIRATPIAPIVTDDAYKLEAALVGYKMILRSK